MRRSLFSSSVVFSISLQIRSESNSGSLLFFFCWNQKVKEGSSSDTEMTPEPQTSDWTIECLVTASCRVVVEVRAEGRTRGISFAAGGYSSFSLTAEETRAGPGEVSGVGGH